ncbi:hypothetical protein BDL97_06G133600 [Sphagnum fallax]|nr:hypothetical protein BDL97_06G133600 [Sphagnum fallax]
MKIFLDDRKGDIITLEVESSDTLADLKAKIREKIGIRPDQELVVLTGKDSEDGWALVDCNIQNESTLYLLKSRFFWLDKWVYISSGHGGVVEASGMPARSDPPEEPPGKPREGRDTAAPSFFNRKYKGAGSPTQWWRNHPQRCLSEEPAEQHSPIPPEEPPAQPTPIPPEEPPAQPSPTQPQEPPAQPSPIPPIQHRHGCCIP